MNKEEILKELKVKLTRDDILDASELDGDTPMGYLLTYIRDNYNLPKTDGWSIAEALMEHFNIDI